MNFNNAKAEQGFTLVEMLVVLSVIGLMSTLMLSMTGQFRSLIAVDRAISERAALQKTANHIATLLEHIETLPLDASKDGPVHFLESSGNNLRFLGVLRHHNSPSNLTEFVVDTESNAGGQSLVEKQKPRRAKAADNEGFKIVLLENIESLSFTFLDADQPKTGAINWRTEWQNMPKLPLAIRVSITKEDESGRVVQALATARTNRQNQ
jgi:prepilin-type N-terminal cleavage/methylation domain-containing protein